MVVAEGVVVGGGRVSDCWGQQLSSGAIGGVGKGMGESMMRSLLITTAV